MDPTVSIIVPVHNRADLIVKALNSVMEQTFRDYEIIVVDDGSADPLESKLLARFNDPRLKVLRHNINRGAAAARNSGIGVSRGRWIAFLDSDDTWSASKLARQVEVMRGLDQNIKACSTGFRVHYPTRTVEFSEDVSSGQFESDILFGCKISPGTTLMVERAVYEKIGLFDERFSRLEDWDWLLRYTEHYGLIVIKDVLADIDQTRQSNTVSHAENSVTASIQLLRQKHLPRLRARGKLAAIKLISSTELERAGSLFRRGQTWRAAARAALALLIYPARNKDFFRSLGSTVGSVLRGEPR